MLRYIVVGMGVGGASLLGPGAGVGAEGFVEPPGAAGIEGAPPS
jgi:hypothetical protein